MIFFLGVRGGLLSFMNMNSVQKLLLYVISNRRHTASVPLFACISRKFHMLQYSPIDLSATDLKKQEPFVNQELNYIMSRTKQLRTWSTSSVFDGLSWRMPDCPNGHRTCVKIKIRRREHFSLKRLHSKQAAEDERDVVLNGGEKPFRLKDLGGN